MSEIDPNLKPSPEPGGSTPPDGAPPPRDGVRSAEAGPATGGPAAPPVAPTAPQVGGRDIAATPYSSWAPPAGPPDASGAGMDGPTLTAIPIATAHAVSPVDLPDRGAPRRPGGLLRWGVALVVVALLVGVVSVGAAMLVGSGQTSAVEGWVPDGTIVYAGIRGDLPGDQKARFDELIARFPGFKDQANLSAKLDETFDRALERSGVSWTNDLKPWIAGEMGIAWTSALFDLSMRAPGYRGPSGGLLPMPTEPAAALADGAVVIVALKDPALAGTFLRDHAPATATTSQYAGGDLTTIDSSGSTMAWAIRGDVLLVGFVDTVKAAIDTKGAGTVAKSPGFGEAKKVAADPHLAFVYLDGAGLWNGYLKVMAAQADRLGTPADVTSCMTAKLGASAMPAWMGGVLQARAGSLSWEARTPVTATPYTIHDAASTIAPHLPADTVVSIAVRDTGTLFTSMWQTLGDAYSCDPTMKAGFDQVTRALAMVGGIDGLIGWAGDTSIAVTRSGTSWGGGIASVATDAAAADALFLKIQNLLALGGASMGLQSSLSDYAGGRLLTLTFPSTPASYGTSVPPLAAGLRDDLFVLGTADFVKATLDTKDGTGLAAQPRYQAAIGLAGATVAMEYYIDITGIREGAEALLTGLDPARMTAYATDVQPFLVPFDSLIVVSNAPASGITSARAFLIFK